MKFSITEDAWVLDQLHPAEWHFICELPQIAAGEGLPPRRAREVMMPDPLSPNEGEDESSFLEDWEEFVQPDLESGFKDARSKVSAELERVENSDPPEIRLPDDVSDEQKAVVEQFRALTWRKITLDLESAEDWFSALNQARLMMNEQHGLSGGEGKGEDELDPDRAMLLTQYEFYSVIQSILIDQIMQP